MIYWYIMQAIILAAGMGKRLGDYTKNNTKCMVPVNGIKLIDRVLNQLLTLNINRVIIVVGYKGNQLVEYVRSKYASKLTIEFINNPIYDRTNNIYSLALAKDKMAEDDTILLESDMIFEQQMLDMIVKHEDPNLALVAKYETWMDGTMVCIDQDRTILNFIPKKAFRYEDISIYYKTCNIYKFSKEFSRQEYIPFLEAYCKAMGNNEYYEQVLRVLTLLDNTGLKALPISNEKWYEIDDIQDLKIAETIFSEDKDRLYQYGKLYGGYWRFPKMLDFCYLVNPYFPTARMKIEMRANFDKLLTEYPSGMYVNSLLAGKYFDIKQDYVVVGNGAAELIKSFTENINKKIGIIYPTFEEYPNRFKKEQIVSYSPDNKNFSYSAEDIKVFFEGKDISYLLLINPDNPTGNYIPVDKVIDLIQWCQKRGITLIVDESFVDFTDGFEQNSLLNNNILESNSNLIVIKSISKSYGVPGLRLGVLATSNVETINMIKKDVSIWNINSFAEFYMQIFGKYSAEYTNACYKFIEERNRFRKLLDQIPFLRVLPSQANYFCCEVIKKFTSSELALTLLKDYDILIKDCNSKKQLENKNFVRISIRDFNDNNKLIDALNKL
jgi:histidinol-phosphate/aromatic aminotransferase/cobyric acid decarboxylase-like protein/choline kinase